MKLRSSTVSTGASLLTLVGGGTYVFHHLENWTWAESFYFSVATLTTVGYGDIHPTNDTSRMAAAIFILLGVGVVIAALTRIGSSYLTAQEHRLSNNIATRIHHHNHRDQSHDIIEKH